MRYEDLYLHRRGGIGTSTENYKIMNYVLMDHIKVSGKLFVFLARHAGILKKLSLSSERDKNSSL